MEAAMAAIEAAADGVLASLSGAFCSAVAVFVQIQVSAFSALWWIEVQFCSPAACCFVIEEQFCPAENSALLPVGIQG
jgi:hypothetical protein